MSTPTRFWLTAGIGESNRSKLEAIDSAFHNSGLGYQNLVVVSSIPPINEISPKIDSHKGTTHVLCKNEWRLLPISSVVHVVQAMNTGKTGEGLASCIALAKISIEIDNIKEKSMLAYEAIGSNLNQTEQSAIQGVKAMIKHRQGVIDKSWGETGFKLISSFLNVKKKFGCSVAFVVFDSFTYQS
ncbi:MAG: pyruvoyl-dependent arginine decarboxylase [Candidatus Thorarchaeota archaeon]